MLGDLPASLASTKELIETSKELDKHYIPTRYPNFHTEGAPLDYRNWARKPTFFSRGMNCAVQQFHPSPIFKHSFEVSVGERVARETGH